MCSERIHFKIPLTVNKCNVPEMQFSTPQNMVVVVAAVYNIGHVWFFGWSWYDFLGGILTCLVLDILFHSVWLFENWTTAVQTQLDLTTLQCRFEHQNLIQQNASKTRRQFRRLLGRH